MIEIELPDGIVVEFPDGTPPDTIKAALRKKFPPREKRDPVAEFEAMPWYKQIGTAADDIVRMIANGVTYGWADELNARSAAALGYGDYESNMAVQKQEDEDATARSGFAGTAAQFVGSALPAAKIVKAVQPVSMLGKVLMGAGTGAGLGALQGAGDNPGDRLGGAGKGAAFGAAIGGAAPHIAQGMGKAYNAAAALVNPRIPELGRRGSAFFESFMTGTRPAAQRGQADMLLDQSPPLTGLAKSVATRPGKGRDELIRALTAREAGRAQRLSDTAKRNVGPYRDPEVVGKEIARRRKATTGPMYERAVANAPNIDTQTLRSTFAAELTEPAKGMTEPRRRAMLGIMNQIDDALVADTPAHTASRLHDLRKWLDSQIVHDGASRMGLSSADKGVQAVLAKARAVVDDVLKNRIPGFSQADDIAAGTYREAEALVRGGKILSPKQAPEPSGFRSDVAAMSPRELAAMRSGNAADILRSMATTQHDLSVLKRKVGGNLDWNRDNIATLHGKTAADDMVKSIDDETGYAGRFADIVGNSPSAPRRGAARLLDTAKALRVPSDLSVLGLAGRSAEWLGREGYNLMAGMAGEQARDKLVKALMASGPEIDRLLAAGRKGRAGASVETLVRALLLGNAGRPAPGP